MINDMVAAGVCFEFVFLHKIVWFFKLLWTVSLYYETHDLNAVGVWHRDARHGDSEDFHRLLRDYTAKRDNLGKWRN